jgi:RHS repeat-associated protein
MTAASYDGDGLRATVTYGASTQQFVWNNVSTLPQVLMDSGNAYIYTGGVAPAEQVNLATGSVTYLVTDSLGSVRGVVSSTGALTATTGYDAWGKPETTGGLSASTPYGYAGGYTDADGIIYLLARYYDPSTGQFLSADPLIEQTLQPYAYASGNPVTNSDPSGMITAYVGSRDGKVWVVLGVSAKDAAYVIGMGANGLLNIICNLIGWGSSVCQFLSAAFAVPILGAIAKYGEKLGEYTLWVMAQVAVGKKTVGISLPFIGRISITIPWPTLKKVVVIPKGTSKRPELPA